MAPELLSGPSASAASLERLDRNGEQDNGRGGEGDASDFLHLDQPPSLRRVRR
jgi:hypothetical protein